MLLTLLHFKYTLKSPAFGLFGILVALIVVLIFVLIFLLVGVFVVVLVVFSVSIWGRSNLCILVNWGDSSFRVV